MGKKYNDGRVTHRVAHAEHGADKTSKANSTRASPVVCLVLT